MNGSELVTKAMRAAGETSVRAFAKRLEVSHTAVQHWLEGTNVPTFEQAAEMAEIAGLPPVPTAALVRMASKDGAKHRALLRRLSQAAAIALCAIAIPLIANESTAYAVGFLAMPIMFYVAWHIARCSNDGTQARSI